MKAHIEERTIQLAEYILDNKATVRDSAIKFGISKSTVHKDVTERLERINRPLSEAVKNVLLENKSVRHIRGGMATRRKYKREA